MLLVCKLMKQKIHSTLIHDYHNTDNSTEFAKQLLKSPMQLIDTDNKDDTNDEYSFTGTGTGTHSTSWTNE